MAFNASATTLPKLGLRENRYQFILLVIVNAFVGAMIGLERTILPQIGLGGEEKARGRAGCS